MEIDDFGFSEGLRRDAAEGCSGQGGTALPEEGDVITMALREAAMDLREAVLSAIGARQRRMIEADPTCCLIEEFLAWREKKAPEKNAGEAIAEFMAAKRENRGSIRPM